MDSMLCCSIYLKKTGKIDFLHHKLNECVTKKCVYIYINKMMHCQQKTQHC